MNSRKNTESVNEHAFSKKRRQNRSFKYEYKNKKNKKKVHESNDFSFSNSSESSGDTAEGRHRKVVRKSSKDYYLKPVQFVSGGFLNFQSTAKKEKKKEKSNSNGSTSSETDSDIYEEYDAFKNFLFDFNFCKKSKNDIANYAKENLKKYNLSELREDDKNFEKYGLGFQILKKMGYTDGIGHTVKTNISPIKLQTKNVKTIEEKEQESYDSDLNSDEINDVYSTDLWKKGKGKGKGKRMRVEGCVGNSTKKGKQKSKQKSGFIWNFRRRKKQIIKNVDENISNIIDAKEKERSSHTLNTNTTIYNIVNGNCSNKNSEKDQYKNTTTTYGAHSMTKNLSEGFDLIKKNIEEHINDITYKYCINRKKKRGIKYKLKNYRNCKEENHIYKLHVSILKNVLTYKYLLNLHSLLVYPSLFNNLTLNQYIFSHLNRYTESEKREELTKGKMIENRYNDSDNQIYTTTKEENMDDERINSACKNQYKVYQMNIGTNIDEREVRENAQMMVTENYEDNLNNLLFRNYESLRSLGFYKSKNKNNCKSSGGNSKRDNHSTNIAILVNRNNKLEYNRNIHCTNYLRNNTINNNNSSNSSSSNNNDNNKNKLAYKPIETLEQIINCVNADIIEVENRKTNLSLRDVFTFLYYIYNSSDFLCLNIHVSRFVVEFLRVFFFNQKAKGVNCDEPIFTEKGNTETKKDMNVKNFTVVSESEPLQCNDRQFEENIRKKMEEANLKYLAHLKSIVLMGINNNDKENYEQIENELDDIIYYNYIHSLMDKGDFSQLFHFTNFFKKVFNKSYYKKVLVNLINVKLLEGVYEEKKMKETYPVDQQKEKYNLSESIVKDVESKLNILFQINKEFDINSLISEYYIHYIFEYLKKSAISESYVHFLNCVAKNNVYIKEIYENTIKNIISHLNNLLFNNEEFLTSISTVLLLYDKIDNNILYIIFKTYFFYHFTKYICTTIRNLAKEYIPEIQHHKEEKEEERTINKMEMQKRKGREKEIEKAIQKGIEAEMAEGKEGEKEREKRNEEQCTTGRNIYSVGNDDNKKKEMLTKKKKELYDLFKKVKVLFQENLMKDKSIKNIIFNILKVINTFVVQDQIVTFPVNQVLDFSKSKIVRNENNHYYYVYRDIYIPFPAYAVSDNINTAGINYKQNKSGFTKTGDDVANRYKFSKKKYVKFINNLEHDLEEYREKRNEENINVKKYLEKYCVKNGILFVKKKERKINGNAIYAISSYSIYINNNIIFIYQNDEWKPLTLKELLKKI